MRQCLSDSQIFLSVMAWVKIMMGLNSGSDRVLLGQPAGLLNATRLTRRPSEPPAGTNGKERGQRPPGERCPSASRALTTARPSAPTTWRW
jgi:hypothetical protein